MTTDLRAEYPDLRFECDWWGFVTTIQLGERQIYPPECDGQPPRGWCSRRHARLRASEDVPPSDPSWGWMGKGRDLLLVAHHTTPVATLLVFGATVHGSPECSIYAYWSLRLDRTRRVTVGEPAIDCFGPPEYDLRISWDPFWVRARPPVGTLRIMGRDPDQAWVVVPWPYETAH